MLELFQLPRRAVIQVAQAMVPWGDFLPLGAAFIVELKGSDEFDLAGFEEAASGLRHLAVTRANPSQDATRCSGGDDRKLHQRAGGHLIRLDVEALAFHHPEQLRDVPAQAAPADDLQRRLISLVRHPRCIVESRQRSVSYSQTSTARNVTCGGATRTREVGRARDRQVGKRNSSLAVRPLRLPDWAFNVSRKR